MVKHIKGYYTEAIQEPRYAGLLPFSFADGLKGDWGYGLTTFFNEDSEYYSCELRKLYINIGREIIGLEPYDFSNEIDLSLMPVNEVYDLGEEITLPLAGAVDGNDNILDVEYELTDPKGNQMEIDGSFIAEHPGKYTVTVTASKGELTKTKSTGIYVRYPGEINMLDSKAHVLDATGSAADLWCWPRSFSKEVKRSGEGSLFINTHATDGTWPKVVFAKNGYQLWDMTEYSAISAWIYNPSNEPLKGIKFFITNEDESTQANKFVFYGQDIPAQSWGQLLVTKEYIQSNATELDITKMKIIIAQVASTYENRTPFYIDEVMFIKTEFNYGFEHSYDSYALTGTEADLWSWPMQIVSDFGHDSSGCVKVTPHPTDGTWPSVVFSSGFFRTFDLTNAEEISIWVYNPSDDAINGFGFRVNNGVGVNQFLKTYALPSKVWTKFTLLVDDVVAAKPDIDLTRVEISFSQIAGTYTNRTHFFLDDFTITRKPSQPATPQVADVSIGFESEADLNSVTGSPADVWTWPVSISNEQAKSGTSSLKITTRQDGAVWPSVIFVNGQFSEFNLTQLDYVSIWVYNPSETDVLYIGLKFDNGNKVNEAQFGGVTLKAGEWTEIKVTKAEILAKAPNIDLENVRTP